MSDNEDIACLMTAPHARHDHRMHPSPKYGPNSCPGVLTVSETSWRGPVPEIVVLCGSTRFKGTWRQYEKALTHEGKIVLTVGDLGTHEGVNEPIDPSLKARLDELHKRKIDLADRVLVLNVDGYLGASTRSEIRYAWSVAHKPVDFIWHMPDEHHNGRSHGLCIHGEPRGACIGVNSYDIRSAS